MNYSSFYRKRRTDLREAGKDERILKSAFMVFLDLEYWTTTVFSVPMMILVMSEIEGTLKLTGKAAGVPVTIDS